MWDLLYRPDGFRTMEKHFLSSIPQSWGSAQLRKMKILTFRQRTGSDLTVDWEFTGNEVLYMRCSIGWHSANSFSLQ